MRIFVFETATFVIDDREDYGEVRFRAVGFLDARLYSLVFTQDGEDIRAISLRRRLDMKQKNTKRAGKESVDQENPEWTQEDFARAVPFNRLPAGVRQAISNRTRGPQKTPKKVPVSIRLSADVVEALRNSGAGWQSRVDEILRAHIK